MYYIGLDVHKKTNQLLCEGCSWPYPPGRQDRIDATRTGCLDTDVAATPDDRHGGDDLYGMIYDHLLPHAKR